ncbi:MAG: TIGR03546 family protein [Kangiellaceae bacterium]|nr:TIGR03546 family protein [Kangiellaceae bacterium]MCW9000251.1 TIGR03546 family protein [Kangiellaceae bacterium]
MLTILAKIFKALNSEQSPNQLAIAISLAAVVGMTPLLSLHNLFIFLIVLWFRVNLTMFLVSWPLFTLLGLLLSSPIQSLGNMVLQEPSLVPMWESFYNTLIGRWSDFYYKGVMGGLILGTSIAIISFPISKALINKYRYKWLEKIQKYQVVRMLKASKLWQLYGDA